jgi:hypothetical protein
MMTYLACPAFDVETTFPGLVVDKPPQSLVPPIVEMRVTVAISMTLDRVVRVAQHERGDIVFYVPVDEIWFLVFPASPG